MLEAGKFLEDVTRGERRFRVREPLFEGPDYRIALAEDVGMDDKLVCVKSIVYDPARVRDKRYVAMRRKALHEELQFLARPIHLLPEPLDWIQLPESSTVLPREPLLIYEYTHGRTLHDLVTDRYPEGIAPTRALRIAHELCDFLVALHRDEWLYRSLDPRHVIVGYDDVIHLVGCGNATPLGQTPNPSRAFVASGYVAPELRQSPAAGHLAPAADVYSLGALLSFMVSAEEPTPQPDAPLTELAASRLVNCGLANLDLVVARCLEPRPDRRFDAARELLPFTLQEKLPKPSTPGFDALSFPRGWRSAKPPAQPAKPSEPAEIIPAEGDKPPAERPKGCLARLRALLGALVFTAALLALLVVF